MIAGVFYDVSYDGRTYHQAQIMLLSQGWNPVYTTLGEFVNKNYTTQLYHLPWIDGYTKFVEIVQSNILVLFKDIEISKMTCILSEIILFLYAFCIFSKKSFSKLNLFSTSILSLILTLNPIFIAQAFTFYVDTYTYVFFMLILLGIIDIETKAENENITFAIIIMSAVCFLNIKFWAYIYFCTTGLIYLLYLIVNKQTDKIIKIIKSSFIILILVMISGISPYYTNLKQGRNILYPVLGCKEAINVMDINIPKSFEGKNYLSQFFLSTFSRVDNFRKFDNKTHQLKAPFEVNSNELKYLSGYDTRICGFGVFWSGILLLACILALFIKYKEKRLYLLIFMVLLSNLLFQPFNWWARFIPQLWAFPVFVALYFFSESDISEVKRLTAALMVLVMFLNIAIQSYFVFQNKRYYKDGVNYIISSLAKQNKTIQIYTIFDWSIIEKLKENGIKTEFVSDEYYNNHKQEFNLVIPQLEGNMYWKLKE